METNKWKYRWGEEMRTVRSYGNLIHEDGTIVSKTTYYFDSLTELLDFRETLNAHHLVDLEKVTIAISEYVEFERSMIEGGEEE